MSLKVDSKEIKAATALRQRPLVPIGGTRWAPVTILWGLAYLACFLQMAWLFLDAQWSNLNIWKLITVAVGVLHALYQLSSYWFVGFAAVTRFHRVQRLSAADHVLVRPAEFSGSPEIVPLQTRQLDGERELGFEFRRQRFCWDANQGAFEKLKYPTHETFEHYAKASGLGSETKVAAALERWGPNRFDVPLPAFSALLQEHLLAPFFVFQVFCVGLWALDDYWYYSLFTLGMLVMFECTVVGSRIRNVKELRSLQTPKQGIQVYRHGRWSKLPGDALAPGDVISIGRPAGSNSEEQVVPADALLLAGTCIVEEAVLTGESTPQWKNPIGTPTDDTGVDATTGDGGHLSIKRDKAHVLFGGTRILQHTGDKEARLRTPDGGCLAVVLRTGFETAQGRLMRTILYSTERVTANNWETGLFILFLLVFAVAASVYVLVHGLEDPDRDRFKLFLNCSMIITSVIPPELPMELSIAVNASLLALARKRVFCTEPFRIVHAGKVEVCCFDKTGTLTSDNLLFEGVTGLPGAADSTALESAAKKLPPPVTRVLAGCQSLVRVDGQLVGDPLELAAFNAVGWKAVEDSTFASQKDGPQQETVTVLHRFPFTSALKRMAVVLRVQQAGASGSTVCVVAKGAPEVLEQHLASPPASYAAGYKRYAAEGARVIALAYKQLSAEPSAAELRQMSRSEAESGLTFAGFAIFQCPLKPESEPALRMLQESNHQLVMITGDTPLTACHAASRIHILDRPVLIAVHRGPSARQHNTVGHMEEAEPDSHYEWVTPNESERVPFSRDAGDAVALATQWDLCLSGDALLHIQQHGLERLFVPLVQVFARTSPEQKEVILKTLRAVGYTTLMCGDGTNDVGALKAAHVGVALLAPAKGAAGKPKQSAEDAKKTEEARRALTMGSESHTNGPTSSRRGQQVDAPTSNGTLVPVGGGAKDGKAAAAKKGGKVPSGTRMLEEMRKKGKPISPKMQQMADWLDSLEAGQAAGGQPGEVPMVKPGDASMASPFTAKDTCIMPCTDIIKQGRCTLVTTVQMFKILGLLCLSTAYSLSVMYLEGVKLGDMQATIMGILSAAMFFVLSNAKPLEQLSARRPHPNIFCAYVFLSLLGQFAVHLVYLVLVWNTALATMPPEDKQLPDTPFEPNLVNSVCFLVNWIVQLTTFGVNYIGHPFNTSLKDNKGLATCLRWGALLFVLLTLDFPAGFAHWFSLVEIPYRVRLYILVGAVIDCVLAAGWERFLQHAFPAPMPPRKGYMKFLTAEQNQTESARLKSD